MTHPLDQGDVWMGPFPSDPCPRCGVSLAWLREGEQLRGTGRDRMHEWCFEGETR